MHINAHTHIFTLRTVLSEEAIGVFRQRLVDHGFPELVVEAVHRLLRKLLDHPELLDERQLLGRILTELKGVAGFDDFVRDKLAHTSFPITVHGEGLENLQVEALRAAFDQLTSATSSSAGEKLGKSPLDIVDMLRIAMKSTITEVADELLGQMEPHDALVALMMDIRGPNETERDHKKFLRQIEGTREAALQRPGRVLPFFAIHPDRPDHLSLLKERIEEGSFVGVKLYPSLGYEVDGPELMRVYEYCIQEDVPILLHCGHGGFYRKREYIDYCDPDNWRPVLQGDLRELRVCFAHFGGCETLSRPDGLDEGTWGATILEFIRELPNAYTDLAYHVNQMQDPDEEARYFTKLAELLEDEHLQRRILFGTDSWLLRMDLTETVYWRYYRHHMSEADFDKIAGLAPRLFLGFPEDGEAMRPNLKRHVDFLAAHRDDVGDDPAEWLAEAAGVDFTLDRQPADWHKSRYPSRCTYALCREHMTSQQQRGGYGGNRTRHLNELKYFRPRDPNFEMICNGLARDLVGCCADNGPFAAGWEQNAAVRTMTEVFKKGDKRLVDVAGLLDSMFDLEEGLV